MSEFWWGALVCVVVGAALLLLIYCIFAIGDDGPGDIR